MVILSCALKTIWAEEETKIEEKPIIQHPFSNLSDKASE